MRLTFVLELAGEKASDLNTLFDKGFDPTWSILDAEAIILFGGIYCCKEDPGYILLKQLLQQYPEKTFYIAHGHHLSDDFKGNPKIFSNRHMKLEFEKPEN